MISFYDIDGRVGFKQLWDLIDWDRQKLIVSRIQARIVKAVKIKAEVNPYDPIWFDYLNKRMLRD